MISDELKKQLAGMPSLRRIYSDDTYRIVEHILQDRHLESVLDYSAVPQSFIFQIFEKVHPENAIAIPTKIIDEDYGNLIDDALWLPPKESHLMPNQCLASGVEWLDSEPSIEPTKFDLVLGVLQTKKDLEEAVEFINQNGIGIFHVHTYFFRDIHRPGPFGDDNFFIQSALVIPSSFLGQYYLESFEDEYIILVEAREQYEVFAGHVTDNQVKNNELLDNMKNRRKGKTLKYGMFVDTQYLAFEEEKYFVQSLTISGRFKPQHEIPKMEFSHRISEVVIDVQFGDDGDERNKGLNTYITSLPEADTVGSGLVRIILDPNQILVDFFALYIEEGIKNWKEFVHPAPENAGNLSKYFRDYDNWLGTCVSRNDILHRILNSWILLPELETQREVIRMASTLDNMSTHLEQLRNQLWSEPETIPVIESDLNALGNQDPFSIWSGMLPYPLSSVLRSYNASISTKEKVEDLFFFFEATTELFAIILLSVLSWNREYFEAHYDEIMDRIQKQRFIDASMGNWVYLGTQLSRFVRSALKAKSDDSIGDILGGISGTAIETISNGQVWAILQESTELRNSWKGHSGKPSDAELEGRHERLKNLVERFRGTISDEIQSLKMIIREKELDYRRGIHKYQIQYLEGFATPLIEGILESEIPLENDYAYMIDPSSRNPKSPTKLLPLLKIVRDSSKRVVVYFYSRMTSEGDYTFVSFQESVVSEMAFSRKEIGNELDILIPSQQ